MSDLTLAILVIWLAPTIIGMFIGCMEYLYAKGYLDKRKYYARIILGAPFWPVALGWWIVRYAPELIGRAVGNLFADATRRIDD